MKILRPFCLMYPHLFTVRPDMTNNVDLYHTVFLIEVLTYTKEPLTKTSHAAVLLRSVPYNSHYVLKGVNNSYWRRHMVGVDVLSIHYPIMIENRS